MNFELEGQVRAFWIDTETKLGIQLPVAHAALTWVTRHAAWVITRYLVKSDGATAYKRLYGKEFHGEVMQLFEQLWYTEPSDREPSWTHDDFQPCGSARARSPMSTYCWLRPTLSEPEQ